VSALILCFALSLYIGAYYGAMVRGKAEFDFTYREGAKNSLQYMSDLDRLEKYVSIAVQKKGYEQEYGIDLSKFASYFERAEGDTEQEEKHGKEKGGKHEGGIRGEAESPAKGESSQVRDATKK
jgi:hypothetical protein